jgi:hypothetical protein
MKDTGEAELMDAVGELLTASKFLTRDPLAAHLRLRETPEWQHFKETYNRVAALIEEKAASGY